MKKVSLCYLAVLLLCSVFLGTACKSEKVGESQTTAYEDKNADDSWTATQMLENPYPCVEGFVLTEEKQSLDARTEVSPYREDEWVTEYEDSIFIQDFVGDIYEINAESGEVQLAVDYQSLVSDDDISNYGKAYEKMQAYEGELYVLAARNKKTETSYYTTVSVYRIVNGEMEKCQDLFTKEMEDNVECDYYFLIHRQYVYFWNCTWKEGAYTEVGLYRVPFGGEIAETECIRLWKQTPDGVVEDNYEGKFFWGDWMLIPYGDYLYFLETMAEEKLLCRINVNTKTVERMQLEEEKHIVNLYVEDDGIYYSPIGLDLENISYFSFAGGTITEHEIDPDCLYYYDGDFWYQVSHVQKDGETVVGEIVMLDQSWNEMGRLDVSEAGHYDLTFSGTRIVMRTGETALCIERQDICATK